MKQLSQDAVWIIETARGSGVEPDLTGPQAEAVAKVFRETLGLAEDGDLGRVHRERNEPKARLERVLKGGMIP